MKTNDNLQVFNHSEFGALEVWIGPDGKPWFPATECAEILKYTNPQKAIRDHCLGAGVTFRSVSYSSGAKLKRYINRPNLSRLIARSNLPEAAKFESWIFDDVLESVFDHGVYATPQTIEEMIANPDTAITLLLELKKEREQRKEAEIAAYRALEKVETWDRVSASRDAIPFNEAAKVLGYKGIGRNTLFAILRDMRVLRENNEPYQEYVNRGYFRMIEQEYDKPNGETGISMKTLIYQTGIDWLRRKLDDAGYVKEVIRQ